MDRRDHPPARTSTGRETASRWSGPGDKQRRSLASERGGSCAARLCALRGETLPASGSAALQDRAARTRRHPRTETVTTLAPAHVGLVGPLHEIRREKEIPLKRGGREASLAQASCTEFSTAEHVESAAKYVKPTRFVHRCGESCGSSESAANVQPFIPSFHSLSCCRHTGMLAALATRRGVARAAWSAQSS